MALISSALTCPGSGGLDPMPARVAGGQGFEPRLTDPEVVHREFREIRLKRLFPTN